MRSSDVGSVITVVIRLSLLCVWVSKFVGPWVLDVNRVEPRGLVEVQLACELLARVEVVIALEVNEVVNDAAV